MANTAMFVQYLLPFVVFTTIVCLGSKAEESCEFEEHGYVYDNSPTNPLWTLKESLNFTRESECRDLCCQSSRNICSHYFYVPDNLTTSCFIASCRNETECWQYLRSEQVQGQNFALLGIKHDKKENASADSETRDNFTTTEQPTHSPSGSSDSEYHHTSFTTTTNQNTTSPSTSIHLLVPSLSHNITGTTPINTGTIEVNNVTSSNIHSRAPSLSGNVTDTMQNTTSTIKQNITTSSNIHSWASSLSYNITDTIPSSILHTIELNKTISSNNLHSSDSPLSQNITDTTPAIISRIIEPSRIISSNNLHSSDSPLSQNITDTIATTISRIIELSRIISSNNLHSSDSPLSQNITDTTPAIISRIIEPSRIISSNNLHSSDSPLSQNITDTIATTISRIIELSRTISSNNLHSSDSPLSQNITDTIAITTSTDMLNNTISSNIFWWTSSVSHTNITGTSSTNISKSLHNLLFTTQDTSRATGTEIPSGSTSLTITPATSSINVENIIPSLSLSSVSFHPTTMPIPQPRQNASEQINLSSDVHNLAAGEIVASTTKKVADQVPHGHTTPASLVISLSIGILFFGAVVFLIARRWKEGCSRKSYSRVDYLLNDYE